MEDEQRRNVPKRRGVRASTARPASGVSDRDEKLARHRFEQALHSRDAASARQILLDMARNRFGTVEDDLERRWWETLTAYTAVVSSAQERAAVRRTTRESLVSSGTAAAITTLQAWAKPRRMAQVLISAGIGDMTCEAVLVEFASTFSADAVARARRFLAEHDVVLPVRK